MQLVCHWCMNNYGLEMVLLGLIIGGHMQNLLGVLRNWAWEDKLLLE